MLLERAAMAQHLLLQQLLLAPGSLALTWPVVSWFGSHRAELNKFQQMTDGCDMGDEVHTLKGGGAAPVLEVLGPGAYFGQIGSAPS